MDRIKYMIMLKQKGLTVQKTLKILQVRRRKDSLGMFKNLHFRENYKKKNLEKIKQEVIFTTIRKNSLKQCKTFTIMNMSKLRLDATKSKNQTFKILKDNITSLILVQKKLITILN